MLEIWDKFLCRRSEVAFKLLLANGNQWQRNQNGMPKPERNGMEASASAIASVWQQQQAAHRGMNGIPVKEWKINEIEWPIYSVSSP